MQKLRYINPQGGEMEISLTPPYIFESVSGISNLDTKLLTTTGADQHGKSFHKLWLEDREVTLKFHIFGENRKKMYSLRQKAIQLTSPSLHATGKLGRLEYSNDAYTVWIPCVVKSGVVPDKRLSNYNHCSVTFYCPSPFFRSLLPDIQRLTYMDEGMKFPLQIDSVNKVRFGTRGYNDANKKTDSKD